MHNTRCYYHRAGVGGIFSIVSVLLLGLTVSINAMDQNIEGEQETKVNANEQLEMAVIANNSQLALHAFRNGANPDYVSRTSGEPVLHLATTPKMVRLLVNNKADINILNCYNRSVLCMASLINHSTEKKEYAFVKELLLLGANPHHQGDNDVTPLHVSALECRIGCTQALLEHNANVHAVDKYDNTPLHYALNIIHNHADIMSDVTKRFKLLQTIALLINAGANPCIKNDWLKSDFEKYPALQNIITKACNKKRNNKQTKEVTPNRR